MDQTLAKLQALSPAQRALLNARLAQRAHADHIPHDDAAASRIPRQPRDGTPASFPLSFGQERLWVLQQLDPASSAYNMAIAFKVTGTLSTDRLQQVLDALVAEQEILRTVFREDDGSPCQHVLPTARIAIREVQADANPETASWDDAALDRFCQREKSALFDLQEGQLLRLVLLRRSQTESLMLVVMHHLVSDAWSIRLCVRRLLDGYGALSDGKDLPVRELPIQYGDYASHQRSMLDAAGLQPAIDYWQHKLAGASFVIDLPADHARPPEQTFDGALYRFAFPQQLHEQLSAHDSVPSCTLFMKMMALFDVLLYRYTQQADLLVGGPAAGRHFRETEGLLGLFLNTLVFRARIEPDMSFNALLAQVKADALGSFQHQELPFELLVQKLNVTRDLSRNPVFQVALNVNTQAHVPDGDAALQTELLPLSGTASLFDLTLFVRVRDGAPVFWFEYNTRLFERDTIARLADSLIRIAESVLAQPDAPLGYMECMPERDRELVLRQLNDTQRDYPLHQSLWECLQPAFLCHASETAVITDSVSMDYATLSRRVAQFSNYLQQQGVAQGQAVGLYMEKSSHTLVAMLAVMRCGAYFIPLDPSYPADRLSYVVANSDVRLIVTGQCVQLPWDGVTHIDIARDLESILAAPADVRSVALSPDDVAYCIYTSGSTGKPKGVRVPHRALVNFLHAMAEFPFIAAGESLLSVTPLSFDISILELLLPLFSGGAVVLVPQTTAADPLALLAAIRKHRPNAMQATPATWQMLLEVGFDREMATMTLLCGGEALPADLAQQLGSRARALWNMYGPTETTIWSCVQRVDPAAAGPVPIGRPIANTSVYLLDNQLQPVPPGVVGALYIGGAGLANGYHAREDLTRERFIADPFAQQGGRIYNTGDLARYRPDGALEYVGRSDFQVKVRGFRIELGEIESCIEQHPSVQQAVVVVSGSTAENKRLVAHLRMRPGAVLSAAALREFAASMLPAYMLPNLFVQVAAYPLTPNGKIDRQALEREQGSLASELPEHVAPSTDSERVLAQIWCEVLARPQIGVRDNFFLNGGHSILAVKVVALMRERLGVELPLKAFFQHATIEAQAAYLFAGKEAVQADSLVLPDFEAPSDEVEDLISMIWAEVLKRERVGVLDNFFMLGGHSMLALKIIARVRDCFEVDVSLQDFFTLPTVRDLSTRVTGLLMEELGVAG